MSETPKDSDASPADPSNDNSIDLIDLLIIFAKWKKLIFGLTVTAAMCAVVASLLMPNVYQATIRILPPQQPQSNAAALLTQLSGMAGGLAAGSAKNPNDLYVAMIKSRTIADAMIDRFSLLSVYEVTLRESARKRLEGNTVVQNWKDGIISIDVSDTDPKRASILANAYGEELIKLTRNIALTQSSQVRLFLEHQLKLSKDKLIQGEENLKRHLKSNGIANAENEGKALMEVAARLRAQVAGKEIQIAAMKTFVTENNIGYKQLVQELASTKDELRKLENGPGASKGDEQNAILNGGQGSMQMLRDVKYYQMLFDILSRQYEAARLEEARDVSIVQILDNAIVPEIKVSPRRSAIVFAVTISVFMFSLLVSLLLEYGQRLKAYPVTMQKFALLRRYIFGIRSI